MASTVLLIRWGVVRISDNSGDSKHLEKIGKKLKVGGNELKSVDEIRKVVTVVLAMLYDSEVGNKN